MNSGVRMLLSAAGHGKGVSLPSSQARQVATAITQLAQANQQLGNTLSLIDNLLNAYVNEYGEELAQELLSESEVVEGTVVDDDGFEYETTIGLDNEDDGLDSSEEE